MFHCIDSAAYDITCVLRLVQHWKVWFSQICDKPCTTFGFGHSYLTDPSSLFWRQKWPLNLPCLPKGHILELTRTYKMLRDKSGFQKQNKILVLGLRSTSKEQCVYISSPKNPVVF